MGMIYLVDTSAYSRYLDGRLSDKGNELMDDILTDAPPISVVVRMELLSYQGNDERENIIKNLVDSCDVILLSDEIVEKTVEIRRKSKIKLPDAIIAATAIVHNLSLISCNDSDFLKVPNLKYASLS